MGGLTVLKSFFFLFDVDGTLLLTGGAGSKALDLAFWDVLGIRNAMETITCDGKTDGIIIREVLGPLGLDTPENITSVCSSYLKHLERTLQTTQNFRLMPGVRSSLAYIEKNQIPCGLATGNLAAGARLKLERAKLNHYFAFGGFGSDAHERAKLVRRGIERGRQLCRSQTVVPVVVGDTPRDVFAAHEAGALAVGVASANFDGQALTEAGADLTLASLQRPDEWIEKVRENVHSCRLQVDKHSVCS